MKVVTSHFVSEVAWLARHADQGVHTQLGSGAHEALLDLKQGLAYRIQWELLIQGVSITAYNLPFVSGTQQ